MVNAICLQTLQPHLVFTIISSLRPTRPEHWTHRLLFAIVWVFVFPKNSLAETLIPRVMVVGNGPMTLMRSWWWYPHKWDQCPYKKGTSLLLSPHKETEGECHFLTRTQALTGHQPSPDTTPASDLILDFQTPEI
jgi:hypothetical protein